jgi:hypothetical protein
MSSIFCTLFGLVSIFAQSCLTKDQANLFALTQKLQNEAFWLGEEGSLYRKDFLQFYHAKSAHSNASFWAMKSESRLVYFN